MERLQRSGEEITMVCTPQGLGVDYNAEPFFVWYYQVLFP